MNGMRPQNEWNRTPSSQGPYWGYAPLAIAQDASGSVVLYSDQEPVAVGDVTSVGTITAIAWCSSIPAGEKVVVFKKGPQYLITGRTCP